MESISTEGGQIIIRRFQGMPLDRQKLEPMLKDGIVAGRTRVTVNYKKLGKEWQRVLEEVLERLI